MGRMGRQKPRIKMAALLLLICSLMASLVGAHVNHRGTCKPLNSTMENFEPDRFVGEWFVLSAFDPDASCLRFNYTSCGAGCLHVQEQKQLSLISTFGVSNVYRAAGLLRFDIDQPARMVATFNDNQRVAEYAVLDTDYDSFAAVYTCENITVGALSLYHRRDVYFLSRKQNSSAIALSQVERVSSMLIANQIENEFEPVVHERCLSADQALLDLDANRGIVERVQGMVADASNAITGGLNSLASAISGVFSGFRRRTRL